MATKGFVLRFTVPPGPTSEFVEAELDGKSVRIGKWVEDEEGFWLLVLDKYLEQALRVHLSNLSTHIFSVKS